METVRFCDVTMTQKGRNFSLSFKEKIELSKLMDRLGVSVIELPEIKHRKTDSLLIKSIASAVRESGVAVPVELNRESVQEVWAALKGAAHPRLQVAAPVSSVQMEYLSHKKPGAMASAVEDTIRACRECTGEVEFVAGDATRSDFAFLCGIVTSAIEAGAEIITLCDTAGTMLPEEFADFLGKLREAVPALEQVTLAVSCSDALSLADACAVAAVRSGVREIKASSFRLEGASLPNVASILSARGETLGAGAGVRMAEIRRLTGQISQICQAAGGKTDLLRDARMSEKDDLVSYGEHDTREAILGAVKRLGYELSQEDEEKVWASYSHAVSRKGQVTLRELDAIVAAEAMQVPPAYRVESYVINTGNVIAAMAHMKLRYRDQVLEGISVGDGAIDAAFLAIEKTIGRHFELDDFQIQAVTEGREALGETVVRLRSEGKLYSGRGLSTDVVGAGIMAYINALNKIVYEEEEA